MMKIRCEYTRLVPVSELKPHPKNPKKHTKEAIERQALVMDYQGWRRPITVSNRSGFMTAGHKRLYAAKLRKEKEVPVSFQDYESEEQEIADLAADNALNEWELTDLAAINQLVGDLGPDFNIDLLGIKDFVLDLSEKDGGCDPDEVPDKPVTARTKTGELWLLGDHRLLVGDCTVKENVERLMGGEKADMVFTDPPYNHASEDDGVAASVRQAHRRLMESEWDMNFQVEPALASIAFLKAESSTVYICASHHTVGKIFQWQKETVASQGGYCVWVKPNPMPSLMKRHWTWDHELISYATWGKHVFNFPSEGHAPSSWIIQKNQKNDLHPTMKPVEIPEMAITHSSNPGQLVVDLFLGSGSTLIACERTNRRCFSMEIDPHYCDVILDRWSKYTGKTAKREDGTPWEYIKDGGD